MMVLWRVRLKPPGWTLASSLPKPLRLRLARHPARVIRRIARRIADETGDHAAAGDLDPCPDLFAQIQAEAATTWRSPATATSDVCAAPPASARGPSPVLLHPCTRAS
jgi:hypothetical protein